MSDTAFTAVQGITSGASASQIVQLFLLGVIAFVGVAWFVKWILDQRIGDMPDEVKDLNLKVTRIEGKLWSKDEISNAIKAEIQLHEHNCPCRNKKQ